MTTANNLFAALILNPAILLTVGAIAAAATPASARRYIMLAAVGGSALQLSLLGLGDYGALTIFGKDVVMLRIDPLSRIFAVVFHIAVALNVIYAWHEKSRAQDFATLAYPASALGGVLAGDFITLFVWWEIAAITSVFLVWAPGTRATYLSGIRYLAVQILSGVLLLGAVVLIYRETGSLMFEYVGLRDADGAVKFSGLVLFLAFGVKSAFPLLHNWVQDAYPKSTLSGTIVLSVFTTKLAVYSLARGFPGTTELVYIGAVMTIFPIFFALIENDLRKVLCYSINNQVGFMVIGVGVGSAAALNGAVGYAFTNIIFESLLFMAVGAAMYRTGSSKALDLGGLYKFMPITMVFAVIGALSISAFPGFAGFVTKGLIIDGAAESHIPFDFVIWGVLLFASAGVLEHAGIKIPYFTFFNTNHAPPKRVFVQEKTPPTMMLAMGISATLCILIGLFPEPLYALMPNQEQIKEYHPYSAYHIVEQLQLLLWAVLAFAVLIIMKWYPAEVPSTNLDTDWFYRIPGRAFLGWASAATGAVWNGAWSIALSRVNAVMARVYAFHGPEGQMARSWPIGFMAMWTAVVLGFTLVLAFVA
ncbi:MAG: Na(+)/H(+) antiporter subunit D [Pseudomonadota bacterium]